MLLTSNYFTVSLSIVFHLYNTIYTISATVILSPERAQLYPHNRKVKLSCRVSPRQSHHPSHQHSLAAIPVAHSQSMCSDCSHNLSQPTRSVCDGDRDHLTGRAIREACSVRLVFAHRCSRHLQRINATLCIRRMRGRVCPLLPIVYHIYHNQKVTLFF